MAHLVENVYEPHEIVTPADFCIRMRVKNDDRGIVYVVVFKRLTNSNNALGEILLMRAERTANFNAPFHMDEDLVNMNTIRVRIVKFKQPVVNFWRIKLDAYGNCLVVGDFHVYHLNIDTHTALRATPRGPVTVEPFDVFLNRTNQPNVFSESVPDGRRLVSATVGSSDDDASFAIAHATSEKATVDIYRVFPSGTQKISYPISNHIYDATNTQCALADVAIYGHYIVLCVLSVAPRHMSMYVADFMRRGNTGRRIVFDPEKVHPREDMQCFANSDAIILFASAEQKLHIFKNTNFIVCLLRFQCR
jgi:hypothetical protein